MVTPADRDPFHQALRTGRLKKLAQLGLAQEIAPGRWQLADGLDDTLRRMAASDRASVALDGELLRFVRSRHRQAEARLAGLRFTGSMEDAAILAAVFGLPWAGIMAQAAGNIGGWNAAVEPMGRGEQASLCRQFLIAALRALASLSGERCDRPWRGGKMAIPAGSPPMKLADAAPYFKLMEAPLLGRYAKTHSTEQRFG